MSNASASTETPQPQDTHHGSAFGWTYWMLNTIEAFERLAYFGIRSVVPIYIMQATEPGGLHLTAVHKGVIYMWWAFLQSWLPMFTGGIADRYGYKRTLFFAISANVGGYIMMAYLTSYAGFFAGILVLATGTAFFKPALQGSIAQNLHKENASMGWGIFYWVVNVGAVCAPLLATLILGKPHSAEGWRNLFLASAGYTAVNLLLLLTFMDVPSGADKSKSLWEVFWETIENICYFWFKGGRINPFRFTFGLLLLVAGVLTLSLDAAEALAVARVPVGIILIVIGVHLPLWLDGGKFAWQLRLPAFLLIMSCFWMMMYQVWDLHPNFIEDWVDSASAAKHVPFDSWWEYGDRSLIRVPQQILLTLNAALIVLLVVPISWLVRKMRTLSAMMIGMSVATVGTLIAGLTGNGWILLTGIVFFSLGEMLTGPKKNQYLGLIAPPGKKGLYLGYVNIPVGIGVGFGSMLAGIIYDGYGEKATLALKHLGANTELLARASQAADWSDTLEKIPDLIDIERRDALPLACKHLGLDPAAATTVLHNRFRNDRGQTANLALQYLSVHPKHRLKAAEGLSKIIENEAEKLTADIQQLAAAQASEETEGDTDTAATGSASTGSTAAQNLTRRAERTSEMIGLVKLLASQPKDQDLPSTAAIIDLLPDALGRGRSEAVEVVWDLVNEGRKPNEREGIAQVVDMLWSRYRNDPETTVNLALEFLAQDTPLMRDAVSKLAFEKPVDELPKQLGIDRTKSFATLSAASGMDDAELESALAAQMSGELDTNQAIYVYLIEQPHIRFIAASQKDWSKDLVFLRELVRQDEKALAVIRAEIDKDDMSERIVGFFKNLFGGAEEAGEATEEGVDYKRLSGKTDLVRKALDAKDWSGSSEHAAQLLQLNPFEARAQVAAELNGSPLATTKMLWETYDPQYKVWIPFAAIGVLATIALYIFGQMAKRWADMNA